MTSQRILIDGSAFSALVSASHGMHRSARSVYERLVDYERDLWTTSYALTEAVEAISRDIGLEAASALVESVTGTMQVFWVESSIHHGAWSRYLESADHGLGFVDWTTYLSAVRLNAGIFSLNRAFAKTGISVLPVLTHQQD